MAEIPGFAERILAGVQRLTELPEGEQYSSPGQDALHRSAAEARRIDALGFNNTAKLSPSRAARLPLAATEERQEKVEIVSSDRANSCLSARSRARCAGQRELRYDRRTRGGVCLTSAALQ